MKKIPKSTIPLKPLSRWGSVDLSVKSVDTSSGGKIRLLPFVVIPSNFFYYDSCKGQYTFIGKGCGVGLQGQNITYKDAWDGF